MDRRSKFLPLAALAVLLTVALVASAKLKSIGTPDVQFLAVGPAGLKIDGHSSQLTASEKDGKLNVFARLTHLETGISLRDKHLRHYLDTDKHPYAVLSVERSKLKMPADHQVAQASATGSFRLHGVTKRVDFKYRAKRMGSDYLVQGLTEVDIRDFGIEVPCYLGVCVHPKVKIKVKFKLREMQ